MDFALTEDQELLRRSVREFAEAQIKPRMMAYDESQEFPWPLVKEAAAQGYYGVLFPEELGGAGLGYVEYVLVVEELSRVDGSIGISAAAHNSLCTNHIFACGDDRQRAAYVPRLAKGEWIGAWSLTEPTAGSDAGGTRTTARPDGKGGWILNGSKTFTTHGSVADLTVVFAVTDPDKGKKGISAFAIEKGTPGFRPGKKENKMGLRASDTAEVVMDDCRVPGEALVGTRGEGFVDAMKILDGGRISIAALALGMARGAYDAALAYAKERHQFGKPIAEFQAIQGMLAEMATRLDAAALLVYRAAWAKDRGMKTTLESSMAKLYASEVGVWIADRALQIFGGYGYVKDFPAEKYYRDMKLCTIGEGTSEIQRLVIAREILKAV
ncbi:MAG TPA: acyl-CoA dehydrogenase family protein [Candidatus Polarisedimenticolaceae bacterium]|nr:acyl-CoA dehydrogenase family protein [Candidatus Polarisedimenticolaceae bacterium]